MFLKLYFIALPVFFGIDLIWLGLVAKNFYQQQLGHLMTPNVNWLAAITFYLLFIVGTIVFAVQPALTEQNWLKALLLGALFGLLSYATYDLTNLATLKDWPTLVTIIDLVWGTTLSASVSVITYFIATKIGL